jgi:acetate kinase
MWTEVRTLSPDITPAPCVAVLNAGSSSVKFAIHAASPEAPRLLGGQIEAIGIAPRLRLNDSGGALLKEQTWDPNGFDHAAATRAIVTAVREVLGESPIDAVGHRVAHGGTRFRAPVRVDAAVLEYLAKLIPLAPLHQPHNLEPIQAILEIPKHMPQVACFDTEFHSGQAAVARTYALPRELTAEGVLRYGFHGLSYEYVSARLHSLAPKLAAGRVVIAHLGNGASLCAVDSGRSVATTMGFTGVEGLVMGTRCGNIDPGVLLYLMDSHGMGAREIEELIYRRCGLLGVSGISADMRALRASTEPAAAEAIAVFVYRVIREIGSMAAALGGLDGLVFTAGIGENDAATRAEVAAGCAWLGLELDEARNARGQGRISADGCRVEAWVIPTDEERMIALNTISVLGLGE